MIDTKVTPYPQTPAEVAAAVLDGIEANEAAFSMHYWVRTPVRSPFTPDDEPACGTTMCAAGWVAHVTGWTLVDLPEDADEVDLTSRDEDGFEYETSAGTYAQRGGERRLISDVARDALGLREHNTFWNVTGETALRRLREIAGR
ncbi:hypothetical protein [Streptomyces sp. NPDC002328]|uniref:hypothetical protein n=1 Tax=Streptomyces sp. NPDC002328 TaxID=3364642 RepID=UPI00368261C6